MPPLRTPIAALVAARTARPVAAWIVAVAVASSAGCVARGQHAIERMTPDQREFVAHALTSFTPRTTPGDLDAAFGAPVGSRPGWRSWHRVGAAPGERVEAWFEDDRLVRLRVSDRRAGSGPFCGPVWSWDLVAREGRLVPLLR